MDSVFLISNPLWSGPIAPALPWIPPLFLILGILLCGIALRRDRISPSVATATVAKHRYLLPSRIDRESVRDFVSEVLTHSQSIPREGQSLITTLTQRIFATKKLSDSDQSAVRQELEQLDAIIKTLPQ